MCQQDDFSVGKLKGIMMNVRLVFVDLSEHSHPMPELTPWAEHQGSLALHLLLESKLCAGKQAYGHIRLVDRSKTTRNRFREPRRYELITHLRGSGCDEFQAVVTHRGYSCKLLERLPPPVNTSRSKRRSLVCRRPSGFVRVG